MTATDSAPAQAFLLQRLQPAMTGLIDGSPSTLAPMAFELVGLAWIRWRFFNTRFLYSFASIAVGGAIIAGISAALGGAAG